MTRHHLVWALVLFLAGVAGSAAPVTASAQDAPSCDGATHDVGAGNGDGVAPAGAVGLAAAKAAPRARRVVRLPPLDTRALRDEDDARRDALGDDLWKRWARVGVERRMRPVAFPGVPARWDDRAETLPDGSRVFRVEFAAPGATALRLRLRHASIPAGAELTLHNADRDDESYGPLRPPKSGAWTTPSVFGERAVLALRVPEAALESRVTLVVDRVVQSYRAVDDPEFHPSKTRAGEPRAAVISCIDDVACDASFATTVARGVARFQVVSNGNLFLCSGTLLNDLDDATTTPWFLTARHCVSTDKAAQTMELFWDYRAATCGGAAPTLASVPRTVGATLVATTERTDCTLVRLTGTLPSNRYFCGWTAARPFPAAAVAGVHHPDGAPMRLSKGAIEILTADFHTVIWTDGVTAEGSSGSGLFDAQKRVIGQLCCGASFCDNPDGPDDYGRFDVSYSLILEPHLGTPPEPLAPDAWDPGDGTAGGATVLNPPTLAGYTHGPHTFVGSDAADWFRIPLTAGVATVFEGGDPVQATLYADVTATQVVATSTPVGAGFSLIVDPPATATYWLEVEPLGTDDVEYSLSVELQDTTPPRAVGRLRGRALGAGRVRLRWRDRARDERGYRVDFLGPDGWVRVGELPSNTTRFTHQPGPGVQVYRAGPYDAVSTNFREIHVRVRGRPGLDAWDPADDTGAGATNLETASQLTEVHELDRNDVADWFRIDLADGQTCTFESESNGDTVATVFGDAGGLDPLQDGDDQEDEFGTVIDTDFRVRFVAPRAGTFWLRVRAYPGLPRATYRLRTTLE